MDTQSLLACLLPFSPLLILCIPSLISKLANQTLASILWSYWLLAKTHLINGLELSLFHLYGKYWFDAELRKNSEEIGVRLFKCSEEKQVAECVVCLCEIEEGEEIRELRCDHVFHKICLDRWLGYRYASCPLCRGSVLPRRIFDGVGEKEKIEEELLIFKFSFFLPSDNRTKWWLR